MDVSFLKIPLNLDMKAQNQPKTTFFSSYIECLPGLSKFPKVQCSSCNEVIISAHTQDMWGHTVTVRAGEAASDILRSPARGEREERPAPFNQG